jgi:hypothetical protein
MRVLIAANWFPLTIAQHLVKAFRQEGHEVVTIGPAWGHWIPWTGGMLLPTMNKPDMEIAPLPYRVEYAEVKEKHGDFDLVMCFEPHPMVVGIPNGIVSTGYAVDCHVRKTFPAEYDWQFVSHSWGDGADAPNARWSPCAYDPEENFDMGLERDVDACLIGCIYQHRIDTAMQLINRNVTVLLAWGRVNPEWNLLYNRARVGLCLSHSKDASDRIMANMAQGCLVVCDRGIKDLEKMGLVEYYHYLAFEGIGELVEKIEQARDNTFRRVMVARAKEAVKTQTWRDRTRAIIAVVGGAST